MTLARAKRYAEARQALAGVPAPEAVQQRIAFHRLKAAIASGLGETKSAAAEMRSALTLAPADAQLALATAIAEVQAGEMDSALAHAQVASSIAAAQALIGDVLERRGEFVGALQAYRKAAELAPGREEYRIALALEMIEHHTFGPAIEVLTDAAARFPKSAKIRTLLGVARYANGEPGPAVEALTEAIELDDRLEPAYEYLSAIVLDSPAAAAKRTSDALCKWKATVCAALELRSARERQDAEAMNRAIATLERAPADALRHCELARGYEWTGRWANARTEMEACVAAEPSAQNHYRLGLIFTRLGMPEQARAQMKLREAAANDLLRRNDERLKAIQAFRLER